MNIRPINISSIFNYNIRPITTPVLKNRLDHDTVSFKGASLYDYETNYDAYCSELPRYKGVFSSPKNFAAKANAKYEALVKEIFTSDGELNDKYVCTLEWPAGTEKPKHMPITDSRKQILKEWVDFLDNPKFENRQGHYAGENEAEVADTLQVIKNNPSVKLIILETMLSDIKKNNKHISPPLNPYAVAKTVKNLGSIERSDVGAFSFPSQYKNELINLIIARAKDSEQYSQQQRKGMIEAFPYSSENLTGMWIKVPSKKHNQHNLQNNIRSVEIISHENWCTKNAAYKASACLEEGDFYVFLEKQKKGTYKPTVGMALIKGNTILQIQNPPNNDKVEYKYLPVVDFIVEKQGLEFDYAQRDDGIPGGRQYEITKRLKDKINGKTLETAIREKDFETIFQYSGMKYTKDDNNLFVLSSYRPKVLIKKGNVPPISFDELGINEFDLLSQVSKIEGPAEFQNSKINTLPDTIKSLGPYTTIRIDQFSDECKSRFSTRWKETPKTRIRD